MRRNIEHSMRTGLLQGVVGVLLVVGLLEG